MSTIHKVNIDDLNAILAHNNIAGIVAKNKEGTPIENSVVLAPGKIAKHGAYGKSIVLLDYNKYDLTCTISFLYLNEIETMLTLCHQS